MNVRASLLLVMLALLSSSARADCDRDSDCKGGKVCVANKCVERKYCMRDKDCPGDQVCNRNSCTSPSSGLPPAAAVGGASREQLAAQNAGMALDYTKNTWPIALVDRPLVVAPGMTEAQVGISKDLSSSDVSTLHPLGVDLYARFGVSDRIHAGLDAVAVCFSDCGGGGFFRYVSVGAGYALVANHDMNFVPALTAAVYNVASGPDASAALVALQPGFLFGWRLNGGLQLFASGGFVFGVIGRDNTPAPDIFGLHVEPRIQLAPNFAVAPYVGYTVPFAHTDFYQVPLGMSVLFVPDRAFDVGATFEFNDIASRNITSGGTSFSTGGTGARSIRVFATARL